MTVALVLDFPGGTKEQYEAVLVRMRESGGGLDAAGGHMAVGGKSHVAGRYGGGWRVIDVWDSLEHFETFRDESIIPNARAAGFERPRVSLMEVDDEIADNGQTAAFAQRVVMPGLDRAAFRALNDEVVPGGARPEGVTFHVNGPFEGGWCVIDAWTSKELHDRFMERTREIVMRGPLSGEPTIEEMAVEATMPGAAIATA